mmetsp:Transcript_46439/g.121885  ORF Transcript_46439/g.121885 Transcript_46439/m.121885 type:complete len:845 (-) Transcript_46439:145-2679(-)
MKLPGFLATYRTEKFIKVDVVRVGLFYRVCQLMALFLVFVQLYFNDAWGLMEVPGGAVNAWDESGKMLVTTNIPNYAETQQYCSNNSYSYVSEAYQFDLPVCEALLAAEITHKGPSDVFFTTSYLETTTQGWPCAASDAVVRSSTCVQNGGSTFERSTQQCGCVTEKPFYPLAVEDMTMAYEHAYTTTDLIGMRGSSANDGNLYSILIFGNGTHMRFESGETIRLPVKDLMAAANLTLDERNYQVPADSTGTFPPYRTTGATIGIEIEYSNIDPATNRAVIGNMNVHANVRFTAESGTWTSAGVEKFWVIFPALPRDTPQEYHLVERWRHGIRFQFSTTGRIHKFDWLNLLTVVLSGLVMLKFANTAADFYAFFCLGAESVVLRNKRCELVSKKSEFAEIGMKAALAATTYPKFDRYCDGTIEAEDIARAFASVEGISWEVAFMIARNILQDADSEPSLDGEPKGLNFVEFMTCLEGDAINFEAYLRDTKDMFDKYMLEDEAEDIAAGKKSAGSKGGKKEPTLKEKLKIEKVAALKKKKEREEKMTAAINALKAKAESAGKDFDDFMKEKEEAEDDAMRSRCKAAFEEAAAEIAKNKPPPDPTRAKKASAAAPSEEQPAAAANEAPSAEAVAPPESAPPEPGPVLQQSDEEKEARLGKTGTLRLKLASASGLMAMDKNGLSDPYVIAKRGKKSKQSKVCKKTINPTWDEELEFVNKVSLKKVIKEGLELKIFDKDGFMDSDDIMGSVKVDLNALETTDTIKFVEAVSSGGVIKFSIAWEPGEPTAGKEETPKKANNAPAGNDTPMERDAVKEEKTPKKKKEDSTPKKDAEGEPDLEAGSITQVT